MTRSQATPASSQMIWMEQRIAELEKLTAQVGVLRDGIEAYLAANDPSEFGCTCDLSVGYICGPCFADKQQNEQALKLQEWWHTATANLEVARHNLEAQERENERLQERIDSLLTTGNAVVERWDSPLWKDLPHTGEFIHALREAITKAEGRCDALQKDADRYRWLRMHTDWFDWDIVVQPHLPADHPAHDCFEVKIDCAIDFVMGNLK